MIDADHTAFEPAGEWPSCVTLAHIADDLLASQTIYSIEKVSSQYQLMTSMGCPIPAEGLPVRIKTALAKVLVARGAKVDANTLDDTAAFLSVQGIKSMGSCEHKAMMNARSVGTPLPQAVSALASKCTSAPADKTP